MEALQLGLELYEGKAHAVVGKVTTSVRFSVWVSYTQYSGLSGTPKQKKEKVSEQVSLHVHNNRALVGLTGAEPKN